MSGPGPYVSPTYGWDPSRPHSAQFWMAPELRRPSWDRPPDRNVVSGVPVSAQGNYPGTPAYPVGEAGATPEQIARARAALEESQSSGPQQFDFARDYMKRFLSFYGAADENVAQLDLADWSDQENLIAAVESLRFQLEDVCEVDWAQTPWPSFGAMWESRGGFGDRSWETVRALISKFCPAFSFRDEPPPPPPMMVTTTGTEIPFEDVPPDAPPPQKFVPAPPETFVPTEPVPVIPTTAITAEPYKAPVKRPIVGYWVGGSALIVVILGGAWYLSRKKKRRNPVRRKKNPSLVDHSYEHGFIEGFDAAEKAFSTRENPCNCPPAPRANPTRKTKRRKNSYSGKIQHPSPQYDVMGYARTPVLQDMPGAAWQPPARANPQALIEYGVTKNQGLGGGWLPLIWIDGEQDGSVYSDRIGFDKDEAREYAESDAKSRAKLYSGNWKITTRRRNPKRRNPKRRKNSYSGKIQHPSPQYDVMGYARTPVLQDMPGATWQPATKAKLNPKSRKKAPTRKKKPARKKRTANKRPNFSGAVCGRRFGKLTSRKRDALPSSAFGLPGSRQYPMPDSSHAAVAKGRARQQLNRKSLSRADYTKIVRKADRILKQCRRQA